MHFVPSKSSIPFSWLILLTLLAATGWSRTYDQQRGTIPLSSVGFQAKTNFYKRCPPSLDQEKEDDHETSHQETSTSFPEPIRVQHQPGNSSF